GAVALRWVAAEGRRRGGGLPDARRLPLHDVHDLGLDGEQGAERRERILWDEGDGAATHAVVHGAGRRTQEVRALEADLTPADAGGAGRQDAEDGARERSLAAAALADEADHLTRGDVQADAVEHFRRAPIGDEVDAQPPDRKQLGHRSPPRRSRGSRTSRSPPPSSAQPL